MKNTHFLTLIIGIAIGLFFGEMLKLEPAKASPDEHGAVRKPDEIVFTNPYPFTDVLPEKIMCTSSVKDWSLDKITQYISDCNNRISLTLQVEIRDPYTKQLYVKRR